jgi:hypothetical protein
MMGLMQLRGEDCYGVITVTATHRLLLLDVTVGHPAAAHPELKSDDSHARLGFMTFFSLIFQRWYMRCSVWDTEPLLPHSWAGDIEVGHTLPPHILNKRVTTATARFCSIISWGVDKVGVLVRAIMIWSGLFIRDKM